MAAIFIFVPWKKWHCRITKQTQLPTVVFFLEDRTKSKWILLLLYKCFLFIGKHYPDSGDLGRCMPVKKKKRPKLQTHRIRPSTSIKMDGQVCKFELATVFLFHCLLLLPNILNSFYHGTHKEFIQEVAVLISYFC